MNDILDTITNILILFPISIGFGTLLGKIDIKRDISNLENELKSLDIDKNNHKFNYIFNNISPQHHYLLRSKKLQKYFNIENT